MDKLKSCFYVDDSNNLWRFFVNANKELLYSIMYKEGKWTKTKLIDIEVIGFTIYADKTGVHIIYSNEKGEVKYCTFVQQQWMGRTLFALDSNKTEIRNMNIIFFNNELHIFYVLIDKESNGHGIIMLCKWNGVETKINKLHDIILAQELYENYLVYLYGNAIEMLYFSDVGNEISVNHCTYINNQWTNTNRLYGIHGDNIEIKMISDKNGLHILNKCKENSIYNLSHVFFRKLGDVYYLNVHESTNKIVQPILYKKNNKLSTYWVEDNRIYLSVFRGKEWTKPTCIFEKDENNILSYNFIQMNRNEEIINIVREVYGIGELDLFLFIPGEEKERIVETIISKNNELDNEKISKESSSKNEELRKIKLELSDIKSENIRLEQAISSLTTELQNKQKTIDNYEEQFAKINHYKQKTEDNYNIFIEFQNKHLRDLEDINKMYLEEKNIREKLELKLMEYEKIQISLRSQLDELINENNRLSKELETEKNKHPIKGFWKF